jgi:hypothetical protein
MDDILITWSVYFVCSTLLLIRLLIHLLSYFKYFFLFRGLCRHFYLTLNMCEYLNMQLKLTLLRDSYCFLSCQFLIKYQPLYSTMYQIENSDETSIFSSLSNYRFFYSFVPEVRSRIQSVIFFCSANLSII